MSEILKKDIVIERLNKNYLRVLLFTFISYFTLFFIIINISTKGPDKEELKIQNIRRVAKLIKKQEVEVVQNNDISETLVENLPEEDSKPDIVEEAVENTVSQNTQKELNRKSELERKRDLEKRKQQREAVRSSRVDNAKKNVAAKIQKIQSLSSSYRAKSGEAYSEYTSSGISGDISKSLMKSGGISSGTGAGNLSSGVTKESGSISYSGGSINDFFANSNFGEIQDVEGIEDIKVSEIKIEEGSASSGRNTGEIYSYINNKIKTFDKCIKSARSSYKTLTGNIEIRFTITKSGRVSKIKVVKSEWSNSRGGSKVESCIIQRMKDWNFDKAEDDITLTRVFSFV
ncbi:MAG: AgmX/PglI C-terminal domain-containing protein [Candidatus Delongbacteria bacterium]|nr:AgmX/PglI C-terminal domain-containing protein [Candidatus Delongbacteria bacterium]MBN2836613.1 AgmX/PglI C-terminal domain-containing protein [Candidatus Delongbacteria bacterium]